MESRLLYNLAEVEDRHWWWVTRRAVLDRQLQRLALPSGARIAELGCGTGGNAALLARHGSPVLFEPSPLARELARRKTGAPVREGRLPDAIPDTGAPYDLVVMTDVLEHVADDRAALARVRSLLAPGGHVLLTVPAHAWLWTRYDEQHGHERRYGRAELRARVAEAGLDVLRCSYFYCLVFPALVASRWLPLPGAGESLHTVPPVPLNRALIGIHVLEARWLERRSLPWGSSLLLLARRP